MKFENRCNGRTMRTVLTSIVAASEAKRGQRVYFIVYNLRYCPHIRRQMRNIMSTYLPSLNGVDKPYCNRNTEERIFTFPWGVELCLISTSSSSMHDFIAKKNLVYKAYFDNTVTDAIATGNTDIFEIDMNLFNIGKNNEIHF